MISRQHVLTTVLVCTVFFLIVHLCYFGPPQWSTRVHAQLDESKKTLVIGDTTLYTRATLHGVLVYMTVATQRLPGLELLEQSAVRHGLAVSELAINETFSGVGMKLRFMKAELQRWKAALGEEQWSDLIICYVDGYDTFILAEPEELVSKWAENFDRRVVFQTETNCWPVWELQWAYPRTEENSRWQFLNSGSYIGKAEQILNLFDQDVSDNYDDQLYFVIKYLSGKYNIALDTRCRLFQSCFDSADWLWLVHRIGKQRMLIRNGDTIQGAERENN